MHMNQETKFVLQTTSTTGTGLENRIANDGRLMRTSSDSGIGASAIPWCLPLSRRLVYLKLSRIWETARFLTPVTRLRFSSSADTSTPLEIGIRVPCTRVFFEPSECLVSHIFPKSTDYPLQLSLLYNYDQPRAQMDPMVSNWPWCLPVHFFLLGLRFPKMLLSIFGSLLRFSTPCSRRPRSSKPPI